jgi:hypothetical protein
MAMQIEQAETLANIAPARTKKRRTGRTSFSDAAISMPVGGRRDDFCSS